MREEMGQNSRILVRKDLYCSTFARSIQTRREGMVLAIFFKKHQPIVERY